MQPNQKIVKKNQGPVFPELEKKPRIRMKVCLFGDCFFIYDYSKYDLVKEDDGSFFQTTDQKIAEEKAAILIDLDLEQQRVAIEKEKVAASKLNTKTV
jgi:hypothetical protein